MPAVFVLFAYGAGIVFACALAPILAGTALAMWLKKEDGQRWYWVSLGAIALALLTLVPVVGWIVRLIVFLSALGITARLIHEHVWMHRKGVEETVPDIEPVSIESSVLEGEHHEEKTAEQGTEKTAEESAK
jgi:MFS family permease